MKLMFVLPVLCLLSGACREHHKEQDPELKAIIRKNTIIIKGSDTELPMVQDFCSAFKQENPETVFNVSGGGSGIGLEALINNETDIANSSREMRLVEIIRAKKNGVNPVPIIFSIDALAIITNSRLGIDSLSTEQLTKIFSGEFSNWQQVGGPDLPIVIYGRDSLSGTHAYLKDHFIKAPYSAKINIMRGNAHIVDAVQNNLAGIGYAGVGFLMDANGKPNGKIWAMPVYKKGSPAYSPYQIAAVKKGHYVLTRPLYQYINGKPGTKIYDFIMSELTLKGKQIIKEHGYFEIHEPQAEINKLNGLYTTGEEL